METSELKKMSPESLAEMFGTTVHVVQTDPDSRPEEHVDLPCGCTMVYNHIWSGDLRKVVRVNSGTLVRFGTLGAKIAICDEH